MSWFLEENKYVILVKEVRKIMKVTKQEYFLNLFKDQR